MSLCTEAKKEGTFFQLQKLITSVCSLTRIAKISVKSFGRPMQESLLGFSL